MFYCCCSLFHRRNCRRRSREPTDSELGLVTPRTTDFDQDVSDEEIIFERKASRSKEQVSKDKPESKSATSPPEQTINYAPHPPTSFTEVPQDTGATGRPIAEVWIVNETSESVTPACTSTTSPMSEPSTWTPNETPSSSPRNVLSSTSLTSESDSWTCFKDAKPTPTPTSEENWTLTDKTDSTPLGVQATPVRSASVTESANSTATESSCSTKFSEESTCRVPMETDATNSSTESCKTPVAPLNEVVITMEDEEEVKLVLVSSNECSSGELLYTSDISTITEAVDTHGNVTGENEEHESSTLVNKLRWIRSISQYDTVNDSDETVTNIASCLTVLQFVTVSS